MPATLVQIQAYPMLKKTNSVKNSTVYAIADSLPQGDRSISALKFFLPSCLIGIVALVCFTAIHMENGNFRLSLAVKDWLIFQTEITKQGEQSPFTKK
jgi:hypothetical protein